MLGNDSTIYETVKLSVSPFPYAANPSFPLFDLATVVAKITTNLAFGKGCIEHCFFHLGLRLSSESTSVRRQEQSRSSSSNPSYADKRAQSVQDCGVIFVFDRVPQTITATWKPKASSEGPCDYPL